MLRRLVLILPVVSALGASGVAWAQKDKAAPPPPVDILVLATSDEHGWLDPLQERGTDAYQGGMAYLAGQLVTREGFRPQDMLLLSAGDMWTGPYESTLLQGRPMVQIMNSMAYDAASIGNHDFDFGQEVLQRRASEAGFPLLSANLYLRGTRNPPTYARPFVISQTAGIKVGIVGLTTVDTLYTTDARNLTGLELGGYAEALRREVPRARAAGAQTIVVLAHADVPEMKTITADLRALGVSLVICGHHHLALVDVDAADKANPADDLTFCNPGPYARSYCRAAIKVDPRSGAIVEQKVTVESVQGNLKNPTYTPLEGIQQVAVEARTQASARGGEVLATVPSGLHRREPAPTLPYYVVDTWLDAVPYADFAISNRGGFRQDMAPGQVTMRDVVGILPFDNYLVVVELTADQIKEAMENPQSIPAGLTADVVQDALGHRAVKALYDRRGAPLQAGRKYKVIINDFMYRGGDRYRFKEYDPDPEETAMHWRDPVIRAMRKSNAAKKPVTPSEVPRFKVLPQ